MELKNITKIKTKPDSKQCCEYVPCFYEKIFLFFEKEKPNTKHNYWRKRIVVFIFIYFSIITLFNLFIKLFSKYIYDATPYIYAAFVLGSIVFWPLIVVYDSELFYTISKKMTPLLSPSYQKLEWYSTDSNEFFCLHSKGKPFATTAFIANCICSLTVIAIFFIKKYFPKLVPAVTNKPLLLILCVIICALTFILQKNSKNLLVTMFVVCCGLSYYTYITNYSVYKIVPLFVDKFILGNILIIILVCIAFFIAGSTILPMLGIIRTFYISNFEERIDYPIVQLSSALDKIQLIKRYFMHLTGVNLLAYFQLFGSVYFLGLLNTDSIVTKVLFIGGSMFPIGMYLATSIFFKRLCHKIYLLQTNDIDNKICKEITKNEIDAEQVQALVAVKEMYADEFEIHTEISKEVFVAMLTPIITAVLAIIFPASNIIGG